MARWVGISGLLIMLLVNIGAPGQTAQAVATTRNPLIWLGELETTVTGAIADGNLPDRLARFEQIMVGRIREGNLVQRLTYLEALIYINQPYDIAITYKVQALEWIVFQQIFPVPLEQRVAKLEKMLLGAKFAGPLASRIEKLMSQVFPGGTVEAHWVSIPEGLPVRVKLLDKISSKKGRVGDTFRFSVMETVIHDGMVVIPKGAQGRGSIVKLTRPRKLGIDARLMLDLKEIRALDSTLIPLAYGTKTSRPQQLAVGASAAGMLILGPGGIVCGLAVKGKEKTIPVGTKFQAQISQPVRLYTLAF
ncbi:MAG: hypothetical protein PVG90_09535 [Bacillota bacterium]|jgi:hypothetical protein